MTKILTGESQVTGFGVPHKLPHYCVVSSVLQLYERYFFTTLF